MTISVTHTKVSTIPDGADTDLIRPSDWNSEHTISGVAASGANSDITSLSGITGGISTPDYVAFDTTYATTLTEGQLGWNGNDTLGLGMIGGNVIQHIGEDQFFYCKASSAITKGQVIMFTGAVGASGVPTGAPATGVTDGTYIMGVAAESIALNGFGLVQTFGTLRNVNTTGYSDGDILWYDPTVTGGLTKTKPSAPNVKVQMAAVINGGSSGGGTILIRIDPGSTLGGTDSNAQITSPTAAQIITYASADGYWKNTSLTAGTGISINNATTGVVTVTNSAPDQTVAISAGTGISVTGTYPNFTVTNTSPSSGGTVTSVTGTAPIASSGGNTPAISISQATTSTDGYLSSTDWNTFNNKQPAGNYLTSVTADSPLSGSGTSGSHLVIAQATTSTSGYLSSTDWNTFNSKGSGTVTSVSALTLGTTGTDLSSTVANGTTTPVITLNVPTASATNRGALSSTDWSTFNNKQATLVSGTNIKTINGSSVLGSGDLTVSASAGGSNTQFQYNNAGTLAGSSNFVTDGTNVGVGMSPDGSSWVQVAAGTATKAPFELTTSAGTLMSTPDDGSIEYDGKAFYGTPVASSRGVMPTEHFVARTGTKAMANNTSLQSLFGGGTGGLTNGALTVSGSESYYFECLINVSGMSSGTAGNFGFSIVGAGTATFTSAGFICIGYDQTTLTTPSASSSGGTYVSTSALTTNVVTATTGTRAAVLFKGIFRINSAGTIIPSIQLTTASAATIEANSWFKCYPVGSDTVISVGNWS